AGRGAGGSNQKTSGAGTTRKITRYTTTDSLGRFNFSAVPVGQYTLSVTDSRTGAITNVSPSATQNQVTIQNGTLIGTGSVLLTVNFARAVAAPEAAVLRG